MHRHTYIERVVADLGVALEKLTETGDADRVVAAILVLAARVEAVEDALTSGLPTAGEGV